MKRLAGFFGGIALGVGLALLIGWVLVPMQPQVVAPDSMRDDYRAEYVSLVAIAYRAEQDPIVAEQRLRHLNDDPYTVPLVDVTESWIDAGRPVEIIKSLAELARALGVDTPAMAPYLGEAAP